MDPQLTSEGKPYAPQRYNEIVEENYYITKFTHTSYSDVMKMSTAERATILNLINRDLKREQELRNKLLQSK